MRILIAMVVLVLSVSIEGVRGQEQDSDAAARLAQYLQRRSIQTGFSGAVLVTKKGELLVREAFGFANRELKVPLSPDHIFRIGSLTKPITAAATTERLYDCTPRASHVF